MEEEDDQLNANLKTQNSNIASADNENDIVKNGIKSNNVGVESKRIDEKNILKLAEDGHLEELKRIITNDNNLVHIKDKDEYTALHRASYNNHIEVVKFLIECGADINASTIDGWRPIHCAAKWAHVDVVRLLVSKGADVNAASAGGNTPLHLAAGNKDSRQFFDYLMFKPENVSINNNSPQNYAKNVCRVKSDIKYNVQSSLDLEEDPDPEPTDYSKRYSEKPVDEFEALRVKSDVAAEDSVKIYQTEGTPLAFSLSSSMTDLHTGLNLIEEEVETEKIEIEKDNGMNQVKQVKPKAQKPIPPPKPFHLLQRKKVNIKSSEHEQPSINMNNIHQCTTMQTPLMFSRSSSLDNISVGSGQVDESVISDFSCQPSGYISPSELPASPCQSEPAENTMIFNLPAKPLPSATNTTKEIAQNSSLDLTEDPDPEPTDYSKRYSEKPVDEFEALSSVKDNSEDDDDDDEDALLLECIQSGMPCSKEKEFGKINEKKLNLSPVSAKSVILTTPNSSPNYSPSYESKFLDQKKQFDELLNQKLGRCSSSSSDSEDQDDQLLQECIISGMPKGNKLNNGTSNCNKKGVQKAVKIETNKDSKPTINETLMIDSVMTDSNFSGIENIKPPSLLEEMTSSRELEESTKSIYKPKFHHDNGFIENVKPPSIMDEMVTSGMTESCASVSSDIFDENDKSDQQIAYAAANCQQEINQLIKSTTEITSEMNSTETHASSNSSLTQNLSLPTEKFAALVISSDTLPIESPTICDDITYTVLDNVELQQKREDYLKFISEGTKLVTDDLKQQKKTLIESDDDDDSDIGEIGKRMSPVGSEDFLLDDELNNLSILSAECSDEDSRATYNVSSPGKANIIKPVIRPIINTVNDSIFVPKYSSVVDSNSSISYYSPSPPRSPYSRPKNKSNQSMVKGTKTSVMRASRSRSVDLNETNRLALYKKKIHSSGVNKDRNIAYKYEDNCNNSNMVHVNYDPNPNPLFVHETRERKDKKHPFGAKLKLPTSSSAHNIGASNTSISSSSSSNGMVPTCSSFSKRLEVQSKIAFLWKKGKSTADKMLHNSMQNNNNNNNNPKTQDLSRSIVARRSFGKSTKKYYDVAVLPSTNLTRSSTYEKLNTKSKEEGDTMKEQNKSKSAKTSKRSSSIGYDFFKRKDKVDANVTAKTTNKNESNITTSMPNNTSSRSRSSSKRTCLITAV